MADHNAFNQRDWLHVHHIVKWKVSVELRFEKSNLLVLCPRCHNLAERLPPELQRRLTAEFESKGFDPKHMAFNYNNLNVNAGGGSGDKSPLPAGKYISKPKKGETVEGSSLTVLKLLEPRPLNSGATRYSFLIGSDEVHGTAFLKVDLQDYYLTPEACALAFGKKDPEGPLFQPENVGDLDATILAATQAKIESDASEKVAAANTPDEAVHEAVEKAIRNILLQISINVGTIFRLQDWAGIDRNPQGDLGELEGTVFEGMVKASNLPGGAPEVSVYSKPKDKPAKKSNATEFAAQ